MLFIRVGVERTSSSRVSPFADWKMGINAGAKVSAKSCNKSPCYNDAADGS